MLTGFSFLVNGLFLLGWMEGVVKDEVDQDVHVSL